MPKTAAGLRPEDAVPPSNRVTITVRGRSMQVPEIDRVAFFPLELALDKINPAQAEFLHRASGLVEVVDDDFDIF